MAYRLIELTAPDECMNEAKQLIKEDQVIQMWSDDGGEGKSVLRVLLPVEYTETLMDEFVDSFEKYEEFRLMLFNVEATLPRPEENQEEKKKAEENKKEDGDTAERISREELYTDIVESSRFSKVYIATIFLSVLVACVGLLNDSVAVIIGAMVIAPLLGPNVSLALASTLGDLELAWRSLKTAGGGLVIGLVLSFLIGMIWEADPANTEIATRTVVGLGDIIVALAAGSAGVLAFTRGISAAIIGVMVAVALLPPLAALGLLLGSGLYPEAFGAFILVVVNIICINLAGTVTFLVQGIRPRKWWEEKKAKRAIRVAISIWVSLLVIFTFIILYWW